MKKVSFAEFGGPDVLHLIDAEEPHAGPGRIRIAVRAAGVNPVDWRVREGQMLKVHPLELPAGVGLDAAGVVDEVGEAARLISLGRLHIPVQRSYTLAEAAAAHTDSQAGHSRGRRVMVL
ncbi:alcohol dehydrogenase catalytic domain-containing protein [Streptomyces atroolivaceus]|uniref:alcohol dehydrogenase catalytic domain-containing protein n=1 Tax=Streptomyces atroolivaceus TaxID=66869 RepID=UPI003683B54B